MAESGKSGDAMEMGGDGCITPMTICSYEAGSASES